MSVHVVIMGVTGCGKTTVATAVHERLGWAMGEGDDFHPQSNIDKMAAGIPLTDADRWPWLRSINAWMRREEVDDIDTVVSCSALKREYRDVLRHGIDVFFVHLVGSREHIHDRMEHRSNHFMPPTLLDSQFDELEPLSDDEPGARVSVEGPVESVIERVVEVIEQHRQSSNPVSGMNVVESKAISGMGTSRLQYA